MNFIKQIIQAILNLFSNSNKDARIAVDEKKETITNTENKRSTDNKLVNEVEKELNIKPEKPNKMSKTKKLYALIVGINDYQYVGKLGGCVNDANRINAYLEKTTQNSEFEYLPKKLLNADATKQNITDAFETHLRQAGADDVAVFYFSGHGAQEKADDVWSKTDADGGLETMVCYDSRNPEGMPDLADKELRYLIHKVAQKNPHIVVIADSCHSGDNTRSELVKRRLPQPEEMAEARLSNLAPQRSWDKFCFAHEISAADIANADEIDSVLPQGKHIQMAACKDRELAYELKGSGIFTSMLLNVLERSNGNVSYSDLWQRIRFSISGKYPQVPQIYASTGDATELNAAFLGGASVKEPYYYNVQRNFKNKIGWTLSIGAIHGMPSTQSAKDLKIDIRDANNPSQLITTASVFSVDPGMTMLTIDNESLLAADAQYLATIPNLFTEPVKIYLHGDETGMKMLQDRINADSDFQYSNLEITTDLVLADYMVYARKGTSKDFYFIGNPINDLSQIDKTYSVTFPNDDSPTSVPHWKWLTEQQEGFTSGSADEIIKFLKVAANWHFLRKLRNQGTSLTNHGIEVIIKHLPNKDFSKATKLEYEDSKTVVEFDKGSNPPTAWFTIEVKNTSDRTYRVAIPALFNGFEVFTDVLPSGVTELKAGETKQAFGGNAISIELPDRVNDVYSWWLKDFNWHHKSWWIKLIVSTEDFSISDYARKALPYPKKNRITEASKGFGNVGQVSPPPTADWTTELMETQILNPFYVSND